MMKSGWTISPGAQEIIHAQVPMVFEFVAHEIYGVRKKGQELASQSRQPHPFERG